MQLQSPLSCFSAIIQLNDALTRGLLTHVDLQRTLGVCMFTTVLRIFTLILCAQINLRMGNRSKVVNDYFVRTN